MKKLFMMIALMAVPFAMQAQTKFHDVEANEAQGAVKCIKMDMMGQEQVTNFTKEGKMQGEGLSDAKYDENGYLQSVTRSAQGQALDVKFKWENGRVVSQTLNIMGNDMEMKYTYNDKGSIAETIMNVGGNEMKSPFSDYEYDSHGNWISRKTEMMGQSIKQTRTIEYYE